MKTLTLITSLLFTALLVNAQEQQPLPSSVKEYYQIFLETPVQKVNKITFSEEGGAPIEFRLSPDGKAIYLLNYKGEGGVKAEVVNAEGNTEEIIRSKCKIHSLQEL